MESQAIRNRIDLAKHFRDLKFTIGAEIGVLGGGYSEVLCQHIPNLKLYCIDRWGHEEKRYRAYHLRKYEEAKTRLAPYNCELIRKYSMDAVKDFQDESLDFVFIDARHSYEAVKEDITEWSKKVRKGGIVSGHDYYHSKKGQLGVIEAVDEYAKEHGIDLQIIDWDMRRHNKDNRVPCWWFTK